MKKMKMMVKINMKTTAVLLGILLLASTPVLAVHEPIVDPGVLPGNSLWAFDRGIDRAMGLFSEERRVRNTLERAEEMYALAENGTADLQISLDSEEAYVRTRDRIKNIERRELAAAYGDAAREFSIGVRSIAHRADLTGVQKSEQIRALVQERKLSFQEAAEGIKKNIEERKMEKLMNDGNNS